MKKNLFILSIFASICLVSCSNQQAVNVVDNNNDEPVINVKNALPGDIDYVPAELSGYGVSTLSDFNSKVINGSSYVDDGIFYYKNTTNISHYSSYIIPSEYINTLVEFTVTFDQYKDHNLASYFSISLRANGCGSVFSTVVEQNGYCFVMHYDGAIQLYKGSNTTPIKSIVGAFTFDEGTKLSLKVGAIEENGAMRLVLINDDAVVMDVFDTTDPILEADCNYLTFCSWRNEAPIEARIVPTKEVIEQDYKTLTMSTLCEYPIRSGNVQFVDNANTLLLSTGSDTAGFSVNEQNLSLQMKINFSYFPTEGSAFYTALRCTTYGRANTAIVEGYSFGLGNGKLFVFKPGVDFFYMFAFTPIAENTDHILEYGVVDIDNTTTYLFAKLDGEYLGTIYDSDNPRQYRGSIIMTNDGTVQGYVSSVDTYVKPLKTKVTNEEKYVSYKTYFQNPVEYSVARTYEQMSNVNLDSMFVNGESIRYLNSIYYGETEDDRAFDVEFKSNTVSVKIAKSIHLKADDSVVDFDTKYIKLQKTGPEYGLRFVTGYSLKISYFYFL